MTLAEFWALLKYNRDKALKAAGKLTSDEERDLRDWVRQKNGASTA